MSNGKGEHPADSNEPPGAHAGDRSSVWRTADEEAEPARLPSEPHTYPGIDPRVFNVAPADRNEAPKDGADLPTSLRAWRAYWVTLAIAVVLWMGASLIVPGGLRAALADPVTLVILLAPLIAAGLNLILFRDAHEEVCRVEVRRHGWLRAMAGNGYSATSFAVTGVVLLAFAAWIAATRIL